MNWWVAGGFGLGGFGLGAESIMLWLQYGYPKQHQRILEIDKERAAIRKESRMRRRAVK